MKSKHIAWLGVIGLTVVTAFGACSGAEENAGGSGTGVCGNGITEGLEQCDDGNAIHNDACRNDCTAGLCGNGVIDPGEQCDDGDDDATNGCDNNCDKTNVNCGNMMPDGDEECDDGNDVNDDECTNHCTEPRCGDGIVQAGEDCDDGNNEINDSCPPDCKGGGGGNGGSGGDPCAGQAIYKATVSNDTNPGTPGSGVPSVWAYGGFIGVQAANAMCVAIGADHVCSYKEVVEADQAGELKNLDDQLSYWVHRVTTTVPKVGEAGMTAPGAGARCNDWTYPTNHISDGEYMEVTDKNQTGATQVGSFFYYFDNDSKYNGQEGPHICSSNSPNEPGCAGPCGPANGVRRAILCCEAACI